MGACSPSDLVARLKGDRALALAALRVLAPGLVVDASTPLEVKLLPGGESLEIIVPRAGHWLSPAADLERQLVEDLP